MTLRFWIATLCIGWLGGAVPAQAQVARVGSTAPTIRVLERTDAGVVFEATATWTTPLADAVRTGDDPYSLALRAVRGDGVLSESLLLPSLVAPRVEVMASDYDEVPYQLPADAEASFEGPAADVVSIGMERRKPTGTFIARMLQYDPTTQTVRRYRRIVASVRFDSGAQARRPSGAMAARPGGSDNPHLAVGQSVLASGTWFRVPVVNDGMYRIDRAFISSLGLSPDAIDPNRVAVFGNGGTPLPALNSAPRIADLAENASFAIGGGDGAFNEGDAVFFYGAAPNGWTWDSEAADGGEPGWRHFKNLFSTRNMYFIRVDAASAQRVGAPDFADVPGASVRTDVTGRAFRDEDLPDGMIDRDGGGSGLDWLGAEVVASRPTVVVLDTLPPGLGAGTVRYRARIATRSNSTVSLAFRSGGQTLATLSQSAGGLLARERVGVFEQTVPGGSPLRLEMTLSGGGSAGQGWIDYVEAFYPKALRAENNYLRFATPGGEAGSFEFVLTGFSAEPQVWDVTDPQAIRRLGVRAADGAYRVQIEVADPAQPRELVAFTPSSAALRTPAGAVSVPNQNLHAVSGFPDYVIVVAAPFREAADELAVYRGQNGLQPLVVDVQQVYNEFSGGLVDMRAVRDYLRFLYDRGTEPDTDLAFRRNLSLRSATPCSSATGTTIFAASGPTATRTTGSPSTRPTTRSTASSRTRATTTSPCSTMTKASGGTAMMASMRSA